VIVMFKCPECGRIFKTFNTLITHFSKIHNADGECPVCKKKFSSLNAHFYNLAKNGDEEHKILYGLSISARNYFDLKRECRDLAYKRCEVK